MNVLEVMLGKEQSYMAGLAGFLINNFAIFMLGSILAQYMEASGATQTEKATLFCTIFIKCFLLSGHSLSDGCLIIETTVNAMMIPPVDIVLGFKG